MKVFLLTLSRKIERGFKRIYRPYVLKRLQEQNVHSKKTITGNSGLVVSLTTFGERLNTVHFTIESIAAGKVLPSRLTLWLSHEQFNQSLPESLLRLKKRGLDIQPCDDYMPHKKYYFEAVGTRDLDKAFVTADDDTLYPSYWLQKLGAAYTSNPDNIHCFRAHRIKLANNQCFAPYKKWSKCLTTQASHFHFSTGACGVLFPPAMRKILKEAGTDFLEACPKADDIWLNYHSFQAGYKVKQIECVPKCFYELPGTRANALSNYNNNEGGNDIQLKSTYLNSDIAYLAKQYSDIKSER